MENKTNSNVKKSGKSWKACAERFRKSKFANIMYEKGALYFLLSFFIPFIIMLIAFQKEDIHMLWFTDGKFKESGDNQFLVVDLWHQYYPFFRVLREKLLTGGSFLYSWQNGIGTNFLSLISYYAASPLNWVSVFFDDEHIRECLMYLLAAKIGFCGAFFSCFLRYAYKRRDLSIVIFSVIFALCSYSLGYYWNVMWFDTIALFPLVMLGVTAMCRERKWKLYTAALALSLISNYYVGFFTCIFTIFMFAAAAVIEWDGFKKFFKKLWLIVRSSVIGIGLGAFMLLPSYLALKLTYSANNTFPAEVRWAEKWQDIFANLISYSEPTFKEGLPNFACGMLAVTLFGVFLFSAGIKIREKIASVLMLALIAVSCNMNQLNYIWHGFHVTNQLPYRFAFIFSFVLAAAAYRAYDVMTEKGIKLYQLPMLVIAPCAVFYMCYLSDKDTEEGFSFSNAALKSSLIITAVYILIFICVKLMPLKDKNVFRAVINVAVAAAVITEMSKNAVIGVQTVGTSDYNSYPSYNVEVQKVLEVMRERDRSKFYRTEMTGTYTLNDSSLYGYNGLSQFSSSANVSVTRYFQRLGLYGSEAGNRFYYRTGTPVANSLLGLKYVVAKLGPLRNSSAFLEPVCSVDPVNLYENKYSLSLGFMMDPSILDIPDSPGMNPFEYQNSVMKKASGLDISLFTAQPVKMVSYDNVEVDKSSYGEYFFGVVDAEAEAKTTYDFDGVDGAYLYGYVRGNGVDSISVTCDGESADASVSSNGYSIAFPMGEGQGGSTASAELKYSSDTRSGNYSFVVYALDKEAFTDVYSRLADEQLNITEFSDTKIKGDINVKDYGVMYFSIPYEKGWSVYVDGKKTDTFPVLDAMLGIKADAGRHEIVLKYSPDGFAVGLIVSGGSLLLFILFAYLDSRKKKKSEAAAESVSVSADEKEADEIAEALSDEADVPESGADKETEQEKVSGNEKSESNDGVSGD